MSDRPTIHIEHLHIPPSYSRSELHQMFTTAAETVLHERDQRPGASMTGPSSPPERRATYADSGWIEEPIVGTADRMVGPKDQGATPHVYDLRFEHMIVVASADPHVLATLAAEIRTQFTAWLAEHPDIELATYGTGDISIRNHGGNIDSSFHHRRNDIGITIGYLRTEP
jgi:hypothetical protein